MFVEKSLQNFRIFYVFPMLEYVRQIWRDIYVVIILLDFCWSVEGFRFYEGGKRAKFRPVSRQNWLSRQQCVSCLHGGSFIIHDGQP